MSDAVTVLALALIAWNVWLDMKLARKLARRAALTPSAGHPTNQERDG